MFYFSKKMLGKYLSNLFSRSLHCNNVTRILPNAVATRKIHQNKEQRVSTRVNIVNELREKRKNYENTFGNIDGFGSEFERIKDDPEDILQYERNKAAQGKTTLEYIKEIKSHLAKNDYNSARKVLEIDMRNDRIRMKTYFYKLLINYNALIGNLEECYRLYIAFKERQGIVTGAIYTSMFNACANCKNSLMALKKANLIRDSMMKSKHHTVNISNYNAMLKAYGRHGDLPNCLKIMDEVFEKRGKIKCDTFAFLFQACISDKNSGLRHAFIVYRKMLQHKVKPDGFTFDLILRCVRDCSLGDAVLIPNLVETIQKESDVFFRCKMKLRKNGNRTEKEVFKISTGASKEEEKNYETKSSESDNRKNIIELDNELSCSVNPETSDSEKVEFRSNEDESNMSALSFSNPGEIAEVSPKVDSLSNESILPNFLDLQPSTGSVLEFGPLTEPHQRFVLLGGVKGFLKTMKNFGVEPKLKTFTLLLECIPSTLEAEKQLMSIMESYKIKFDIAFFNVLIKRRISRDEPHLIKDCLKQMHDLNLTPDIITFGVLALSCRTRERAAELLRTMSHQGFRPNSIILENLLKHASQNRDMHYVLDILREAKESEAQLSPAFLGKLSRFVSRERNLRRRDKKEIEETHENEKTVDRPDRSSCQTFT